MTKLAPYAKAIAALLYGIVVAVLNKANVVPDEGTAAAISAAIEAIVGAVVVFQVRNQPAPPAAG